MCRQPGPKGRTLSQKFSSTASSVRGPRKAAAIQETVVMAMPISNCSEKPKTTPFLERIRKTMATLNELIMATISHRSEEHTFELQSLRHLVCRLLLEKKKKTKQIQL